MSINIVRKISPALGYLRRMDELRDGAGNVVRAAQEPALLMRIKMIIDEGVEIATDKGLSIAWRGRMRAEVADRDGAVSEYDAPTAYLPGIASDFLLSAFQRTVGEAGGRDKNATGVTYRPVDGDSVIAVLDIGIRAPTGKRESAVGYEYTVEPLMELRGNDPFAGLTIDAEPFGDRVQNREPALIEAPSAPKKLK